MSEFRSMDITVMRNEEFRTITLTDDHDPYTVANLATAADYSGYEVVSVVVYGYDFTEEMWPHIGHLYNIPVLFEAFKDSPNNADDICAFITVRDCADVDNWADTLMIFGQTHEEVVRNWTEIFHKVYRKTCNGYYETIYVAADVFPSWMVINWEDTLDQLARDNSSSVTEFNGYIYYFGE